MVEEIGRTQLRMTRERELVARLSPELHVLLLCLRRPLALHSLEQIAACSQAGMDWQRLLALAQRHRVSALVAQALRSAAVEPPADVAVALRQLAASSAIQAMALSVEALALHKLLSANKVDAVFLKGPTLAMLAYGNLTVRHSKDMDVLVPPAAVPQVFQVLQDAGYTPTFEISKISPDRQSLWFRYSKAMDWTHTRTGAQLELHWRLTDLPLLQDAFAPEQTQQVTLIDGKSLTTLAPDALLAYLCVHGAMHGWMRLKWLADVYALLPRDAAACGAMYARLLDFGAGRAAGQALLLCHDLFGLQVSLALRKQLEASWTLRFLRRSALRRLRRGDEIAEIHDLPFGTTSVYFSRLLLGGGVRQFLLELQTWSFRPDELLRSRLPRPMFFLFPFVRVASWVGGRLQYGGRSPQQHG